MSALTDLFTALANKIRSNVGGSDTYTPTEMVSAIDDVYDAGETAGEASAKVGTAVAGDVLSGKTFTNSSTVGESGSMTNNGAVSPSGLNAGGSYTIPAGYHNGNGVVTANSLASQTGVDFGKTAIDASHVVTGYQGWVNGNKVSGSYNLPSGTKDNTGSPLTTNGDHTITGLSSYTGVKVNVNVPTASFDGDAAVGNVLYGKTFYSDSSTKKTGSMTNVGKQTITLSASSTSATITQGYHDGTGSASAAKSTVKKNSGSNLNTGSWSASLNAGDSVSVTAGLVYAGSVTANSLASQTGVDSGKTAIDASHVVSGYQGWVNGSKVSGSYNLPSGTKDNTGSPLTTNGDHTISGLDSYAGVKVNVNVPNPTLDGDAVAGNVLSGKTFYSNSYTKLTGSISSKAAATYNTSSSDQTISAGQYLSGAQTIKAVTTENISAANIKQGVTVKVGDANDDDRILSVTGTYTGGGGTPTETLLWQNSSPSTAISYTTVTLSESIQNFDYIKVVGQVNPSGDTTEIIAIMPVSEFINIKESNTTTGSAFLLAYQKGSSERHYRLVYYVSNTQVKFSRSDAGSSGTSTRTMPYKIYGVKY